MTLVLLLPAGSPLAGSEQVEKLEQAGRRRSHLGRRRLSTCSQSESYCASNVLSCTRQGRPLGFKSPAKLCNPIQADDPSRHTQCKIGIQLQGQAIAAIQRASPRSHLLPGHCVIGPSAGRLSLSEIWLESCVVTSFTVGSLSGGCKMLSRLGGLGRPGHTYVLFAAYQLRAQTEHRPNVQVHWDRVRGPAIFLLTENNCMVDDV